MPDSPSVAVLILNWNGERDTIEAVDSLSSSDYVSFQTIVIDNGSRPESRDEIRRARPDAEIVENGANLGYAGGNNAGLRLALERGAAYCLVLNNDAVVDPTTLTRLVEAAESDSTLAVVGPRVYRYDDPDTPFYPAWRIDWRRWLFHRVDEDGESGDIADVDYVQGCAMMIRSRFLREQGLFDERFHLYCEDADLCVRAQRAGWRTVELRTARIRHKGYGSSSKESPLKTYYSLRNQLLFIAKHAPKRNRPLLRAQLLTFGVGHYAIRALKSLGRGDFRRGFATLRAVARALLDWSLGRYGAGPRWLFRS
ncbi:glycosyltransferase family 2 protein [Candidatus Sumerlaeota bacterium]|nr:glycosyltransferase family 2 protein [Candidatus Sumerlaeota bacterium]